LHQLNSTRNPVSVPRPKKKNARDCFATQFKEATMADAKIFSYVIAGMFTIMLGMTGYIASNISGTFDALSHRIDRLADEEISLANRVTILETELNDLKRKSP
jgi:hypothetical protein